MQNKSSPPHEEQNKNTVVSRDKVKEVAIMLKALHACEDRRAAIEKAQAVMNKLESNRPWEEAKKVKKALSRPSPITIFRALTGERSGQTIPRSISCGR